MSFVAGLLRGFNQRSKEARDQARLDQDRQDAREDKILSVLAQSDDAEVSHSAVLASLEKATGAKAPKGGFLASLMGPRTAAHPAVEQLLKLANSPTQKEVPGLAVSDLSFESAGTTAAPKPPASAPAPTGPPPAVSASPQTVGTPPPATAAPGSAAMPPVPTPGSMPGGAALPSPGAPPPPPAGGPGEKTAPFPSPVLAMSTPVFKSSGQKLPGTSVSVPRKIFLSTTERALEGAKAKAQGDVEGEIAGMVAAGIPEDRARAAILLKYERTARAGARDSFAEGPTIRKADGTWVQQLYNRYDPSDIIEMPATDPALQSVAPVNENAQLASELFAASYPGMSPTQILAALNPAQRRQMYAENLKRLTAKSFATGTGTGQAAINTDLNKPIGVQNAQDQNVAATTTIADLGNSPLARPLPVTETRKLAEYKDSIDTANELAIAVTTTEAGKPLTGLLPYLGAKAPNFITEFTGWGVDDKSRLAVINLARQIIGKAFEDGVLRKEDEVKYKDILPVIQDPPGVVAGKLSLLKQRVAGKQQTLLDELRRGGFRVDGPGGPPPPLSTGEKRIEYEIVNGQLVRKGGGEE